MRVVIYILIAISGLCFASCDREMDALNKSADPFQSDGEGYWKLVEVNRNGKTVELSSAESLARIKVTEYTKYDSIYSQKNRHFVFEYFDSRLDSTTTLDAIAWKRSADIKDKKVTNYYRISPASGFNMVIFTTDSWANFYRIEVSNVMSSGEYDQNLDSIRYVYIPAEKF